MHARLNIDMAIAIALDRMRQLGADTDDVALLAGAARGTDELYVRTVRHAAEGFVAELSLIALSLPDLRRLERLADQIRRFDGNCQTDFSRAAGLRLYTDEASLPWVTLAAELFNLSIDHQPDSDGCCMRLFDPLGNMQRIDVFLRG